MMGIGAAEITIVLMFLGGFGLPLGVPPQPENPAMQYVAPEQCLLYSTWAGMAKPDGTSANQTEQLFAEPEVQAFAASLDKTIGQVVSHFARQSGDPKGEVLAKVVPMWTRTVITKASSVYATKAEIVNGRLSFEGGLIVEGGAEAGNLADGLVQLMTSPDNPPQPVTVGAVKLIRFAPLAGGPIDAEVTIGAAGPYVLVGFGKGAVEGMMDRVRAKKTPAWLTEIGTRLPVERRASFSYVNTRKLMETFLPLAGPDGAKIVQALGLEQLGELISVTGLDKEGMLSRSLMKIDGNPTGLLALVDTQGIKPEQIAFLPKDATFATAFSLNTQQIYSFVGHLVAQTNPEGAEEFEQLPKDFQQMFRMRLQEDLLASLGETWTLSMSPADGWLGMNATVEVRDVAKIGEFQKRLEGMFSDGPPGSRAPQVDRTLFEGHTINSLAIPQMPFRPAWCLSGSRLIVALSPQTIKAQLSAKPGEVGLFAAPQFAQAFQGEGRVVSLSYQDTQKVFETVYSYLTILAPMMMDMGLDGPFQEGPPAPKFFDFNSLPSSRSIHRHLRPSVAITRRTKDGLETESRQTFPTVNIGTAAPVAVALLLPAVQAARSAARRTQSMNNLKQQMLAIHNYESTFRNLPAAYSADKEGKPLLSWRVHILPFVEQQQLYSEFKLDEPWDSEHNKKLIPRMPAVYRSPVSSAAPGMTTYLAVGGERGAFPKPKAGDPPAKGLRFTQFTDGLSNTVAIVEASDAKAVTWTKPEEFVPDEAEPTKGLLGAFPGGFLAAVCDGSVRFISQAVNPKALNAAFQRDDGSALGLDD